MAGHAGVLFDALLADDPDNLGARVRADPLLAASAAEGGRTALLARWIVQYGGACDARALQFAIMNGHGATARWLLDHGGPAAGCRPKG